MNEVEIRSQAMGPEEARVLMSVHGLSMAYARRNLFGAERTETHALRDISFELREGETLAVVGPSGSGKSSLARCLVLLETPSAGRILFQGIDILQLPSEARRKVRQEMHLIFQDAATALNPRRTVREIVSEPLVIHRKELTPAESQRQVREALEQVELGVDWHERHPRELSGGQRQRVALARALILRPKLLILDEAVSSLDLSAQGQLGNLLLALQRRHAMSYLYVTHDMRMASVLAHHFAVLDGGRIVRRSLPTKLIAANQQPVCSELPADGTRVRL
jgi:ABC-type glutathione transport system ATPase component